MFRIAYSKQADPSEWPAVQVERSSRLGNRPPRGFGLTVLERQIGKVDTLDRQSDVGRDELVRRSAGGAEGRAKRLVATCQFVHASLESGSVKLSHDSQGRSDVERRLSGRELIEKPQRLL